MVKKIKIKTKDNKLIYGTKKIGDNLKKATKTLVGEYKKHLTTAFTAALAFVIALYMKDVIQDWIKFIIEKFDLSLGVGLIYKTVTALIVIAICVVGIIFVSKWGAKEEKK